MKKFTLTLLAAAALGAAAQAETTDGAWQFLSTGQVSTYAIKTDGSLWDWGSGSYGELGNGSKTERVSTPAQVGTDTDWVMVAGGSGRAFAIKADGTLWSTGTFEGGVLGTDASANQTTLQQVGTDTDWKFVATSINGDNYDAMAIKTDGSLWAWGKNEMGELGLGDYSAHRAPTQVGTDTDWVSVSLGRNHTVALKADGSIWGAGECGNGALGNNTGFSKVMIKVADPADWKSVTAINNATYAIKTDGSLWAWGDNTENELGIDDATLTAVNTPTRITAITEKVFAISGSEYFRVAATGAADQATGAYSWGWNYQGMLGNGTGCEFADLANRVLYTTPQKVLFDEPVSIATLCSGLNYSVVLTAEGNLLGWGSNNWGQLGTSEPENMLGIYHTTPIEVAADQAPVDPGVAITPDNIPASLAAAEKITLTGEWGTEDLAKLIPALGNGQGIMGFNFNTILKEADMSGATFKPATSLAQVLRNCKALETVLMPTDGSAANVVSLNNAFLNDESLKNIDIAGLVNVTDLCQAFQNCSALETINIAGWNGVTDSELAFANAGLTTIALPGEFALGDRVFANCFDLRLIDWSAYAGTECPVVDKTSGGYEPFNTIDFVPSDMKAITVIVPAAAYESFSTDSYWKGFTIEMAAAPGTYTVDGDAIPASLTDATTLVLTGLWDTDKFAALAAALGTGTNLTDTNATLLTVDASGAQIAPDTKMVMSVKGIFGSSDKGVFQNFTSLESFIMPAADQAANFTSFKQIFSACAALKEIDLSGCSALTATNQAFYNCTSLAKVTLPAEFTINTECFDRCESLREIDWSAYAGAEAPAVAVNGLPSLTNPKDLVVKVPMDVLNAFLDSAKWSAYTIVGVGSAGIDAVGTDAAAAPRAVYDLRGRRVTTIGAGADATALPAGLYIIGGKKVLVK